MVREHDTRRATQVLAALATLVVLTLVGILVPAGPAAAAGPPTLLLEDPQAFTGQLARVTFSGFTECQQSGAPAALLWDNKTTLASGVQIGKQPINVSIRIPDATTGLHTISGICPDELVDAGYGPSAAIEVVPAPHPTITVTPNPAPAGTTAEVTARELPTACATGSPAFTLAGQVLAVRLPSQQPAPYLKTGETVANLLGTFTVPFDPPGTYRIVLRCQGLLQAMAADLAIVDQLVGALGQVLVPSGPASSPAPVRSNPPAGAGSSGNRAPSAAPPSGHPTAIAGGGTGINAAQKFVLGGGMFVAILIMALVAILLGRRPGTGRRQRVLVIGHARDAEELAVTALTYPPAHTVSVRHHPDAGTHHVKGPSR